MTAAEVYRALTGCVPPTLQRTPLWVQGVSLHEEFVIIKLEYGTSAQDNRRESLYGTQLGSSQLLVLAIPVGQECATKG